MLWEREPQARGLGTIFWSSKELMTVSFAHITIPRASVIRNNYVIHGIAIHSVDSVRYSQNNSAQVYKHQFEIGSVCDTFWLFSAYSGSIHSRIPNPSVKTTLKLASGINLWIYLSR